MISNVWLQSDEQISTFEQSTVTLQSSPCTRWYCIQREMKLPRCTANFPFCSCLRITVYVDRNVDGINVTDQIMGKNIWTHPPLNLNTTVLTSNDVYAFFPRPIRQLFKKYIRKWSSFKTHRSKQLCEKKGNLIVHHTSYASKHVTFCARMGWKMQKFLILSLHLLSLFLKEEYRFIHWSQPWLYQRNIVSIVYGLRYISHWTRLRRRKQKTKEAHKISLFHGVHHVGTWPVDSRRGHRQ
jgi:hypothetical protein